ncbi:MAG: FHA domain-containing protein [Deltaproteobacteria bacterium]|nr:FHA domain-containing protein [Deltaproteobacteria bacterium]
MELSRERLVLFTGAGLLGGLAGWAAAEPLAAVGNVYLRALLLGAMIGVFVGAFIGAIEGLSAGHKNQTWQGVQLGGVAGLAGGSIGLLMGELAFGLFGGLGGRVVGWGVFGLAAGLGAGWVGHSFARLRNGGIGGGLGGAVGGALYQLVTALLPQTAGRGLALALLGALIGLFIGLVSEILKRGWFMVIRSQSRNAREGKEYPLIKAKTTIGRAEESDVGLFGDQSVANMHALVERQKGKFLIARGEGQVRVNHVPVTQPVQLKNGDRIEVGGTLFLFRERVALFLMAALVVGATAAFASDAVVVSLTNPRLENFANGGAVGLYFSATDLQGKPVGQISPENIEVQEDGQKVQVVDFRGEEQGRPVDIVVVFDITESMQPYIDGLKEATIDFADRLAKANRDYRLGLVTFEDYVVREDPVFTRSAREFKSWVGALQASGGGDIPEDSLDALMAASRFPFRPDAQAVVILITDAPNHFRGDGSNKTYGREVTNLTGDAVIAELKKANINVFAVAPWPREAPDLYKIAKETSGRYYEIMREGARFPELIGELGRSLASQYFLTYLSPRPVEDGTRREISLKVTYKEGEGEARIAYQVRGVGGARLVAPSPVPGAPPAGGAVSYAWWNVVVPLLACAGLLLLARVRLSELPAEVLNRLTSVSGLTSSGASAATPGPMVPEKPAPYARLVRQSPIDEVPREIAFARDEIVIGRGEECDVVIPHASISREHARVKKLKPGYVLFDLKSKNGTYVNGRPIVENLLKDGMAVRIGEIEFVFYGASQSAQG